MDYHRRCSILWASSSFRIRQRKESGRHTHATTERSQDTKNKHGGNKNQGRPSERWKENTSQLDQKRNKDEQNWCKLHKTASHSDSECFTQQRKHNTGQGNTTKIVCDAESAEANEATCVEETNSTIHTAITMTKSSKLSQACCLRNRNQHPKCDCASEFRGTRRTRRIWRY